MPGCQHTAAAARDCGVDTEAFSLIPRGLLDTRWQHGKGCDGLFPSSYGLLGKSVLEECEASSKAPIPSLTHSHAPVLRERRLQFEGSSLSLLQPSPLEWSDIVRPEVMPLKSHGAKLRPLNPFYFECPVKNVILPFATVALACLKWKRDKTTDFNVLSETLRFCPPQPRKPVAAAHPGQY